MWNEIVCLIFLFNSNFQIIKPELEMVKRPFLAKKLLSGKHSIRQIYIGIYYMVSVFRGLLGNVFKKWVW